MILIDANISDDMFIKLLSDLHRDYYDGLIVINTNDQNKIKQIEQILPEANIVVDNVFIMVDSDGNIIRNGDILCSIYDMVIWDAF